MILKIKDETFSGKILHEIELEMANSEVQVKDIIKQRVEQEVANYNQKLTQFYNGLVLPNLKERQLNSTKKKAKIDAEKQVYVALNAFQENGFFVLIDNKQAESLEQIVELQADTQVSFIKLTQLVGG